ncbi:MAG: hypothetical protein V1708_04090 [Candidatus Micrarchaeota archaeon]
MPAFISTCRKPRQLTRSIARLLSLFVGSGYENRGKRSVAEVMSRAGGKGFSRVAFLHERHGALSSIEFYEEKAGWLPEILEVKAAKVAESRHRVPKEMLVRASDAVGEKIAGLFAVEGSKVEGIEPDECALELFSSEKIDFFSRGELRLSLSVRLRQAEAHA